MATFGENFQQLLRGRGLTQEAAARLLGTKQSVVSYYCNLERAPRHGTLLNITDRLGISLAELKGEKESSGKRTHGSSKMATAAVPPEYQALIGALDGLKVRWKKKPVERETITHLLAALFPEDVDQIASWLHQK
jgi:transcriptional regulator with XRE-family HTH domain